MTRTVSSIVTFDCDYTGCDATEQTPGPLPDGWSEDTINEKVADAVLDSKQQVITPEQRASNNYHLCPEHIPKLG